MKTEKSNVLRISDNKKFQPKKEKVGLMPSIFDFFGSELPAEQDENPIEYLSLDAYVSEGKDSVLYVRINGLPMSDVDIRQGDIAIVDRESKPSTNDIIVCKRGENYLIKPFSEVEFNSPLKLATNDGKTIKGKPKVAEKITLIGVVTHVLKTLRESSDEFLGLIQ
jgi:SOS-response transcriptional repressor LexA